MKRNLTRIVLKSTNPEVLEYAANNFCPKFEITGVHSFKSDGVGVFSLGLDIHQNMHPLSQCRFLDMHFMQDMVKMMSSGDFEIVVIEYMNSNKPTIRKISDEYSEIQRLVFGDISDVDFDLAVNGNTEAGNRIYESVASIEISDDELSNMRTDLLLRFLMKSNLIPPVHLVESIKDRFKRSEMFLPIDSDETVGKFVSWFEAACLKAKALASLQNSTHRQFATI